MQTGSHSDDHPGKRFGDDEHEYNPSRCYESSLHGAAWAVRDWLVTPSHSTSCRHADQKLEFLSEKGDLSIAASER